MADAFLALSEILTGFNGLSPVIAAQYQKEVHGIHGASLDQLLAFFENYIAGQPGDLEELAGKLIWTNGAFRAVCQSVILIWYNASITLDAANTWLAPPETYYEALLWKAIEAHPPALSGGYFGYWRYAPEN